MLHLFQSFTEDIPLIFKCTADSPLVQNGLLLSFPKNKICGKMMTKGKIISCPEVGGEKLHTTLGGEKLVLTWPRYGEVRSNCFLKQVALAWSNEWDYEGQKTFLTTNPLYKEQEWTAFSLLSWMILSCSWPLFCQSLFTSE